MLQPIRLGTNNLYPLALREGGYVVIDAGPDGREGDVEAWTLVEAQLDARGIAPGEVRAVVVTHEHIDHAGLAARWAAAGARIVAARAAWPALVAGYTGYRAQRVARAGELRRHGCPDEVVEAMTLAGASAGGRRDLAWASCLAHALEDAAERDTFALASGRTLRLIPTPGHTPGHLVGWIEADGALYSGDALLPDTIPTPGLQFPGVVAGDPAAARVPSLPAFLASIEAIAALRPRRVLPGHGEPVDDPSRLVARVRTHHARRAREVRDALQDGDALCAYGIARARFPRLPAAHIAQAMTEVIGHLDLLEAAGLVRCGSAGDVLRYALV